ncbi:ribonuclease H-like domain-containing protein [Favolaschia claudopus]|uniref:Ribonuclease H-like domain-containing protein n=1 Tax=Favolaschia claudopus TaxID=2862362 RepID=A0AAW0D3J9_9AGAR
MGKMDIADGENVIALTTDNPTVMQSLRRKFEFKFPWVLTFACFLHGINTILGKIVSYPGIKEFIVATAAIVSFFNSSHYWGGQLEEEAKAIKQGRSLKTRTESRWYSLILQALSVVVHRVALVRVCSRPDAQKKTNGMTPVSANVIKWVMNLQYWERLDQIIKVCKPLVDAIGNLENREVNLADCMLELLRCAKHVSSISLQRLPGEDWGFLDHARTTFVKEFQEMNTDVHALALFLHPRCRKLAVSQVAKSRTFEQMCKTAGEIAMKWKWNANRAGLLMEDMQNYYLCKGVFAGSTADAKEWWEGLPISGEKNPLKVLAITLFSIVPHAAEVERLFSGLSGIQGVKRCNLSVPTFESLGKLRNNYSYHIYQQHRAAGLPVHRKHGHMHTRAEPGIDVDLVDDLEASFTWKPPLIVENISDGDGIGVPIEQMTPEQIEAELNTWEAELAAEQAARPAVPMRQEPTDVPLIYDLDELDRIDSGAALIVRDDVDIRVGKDDSATWDLASLLASKGIGST